MFLCRQLSSRVESSRQLADRLLSLDTTEERDQEAGAVAELGRRVEILTRQNQELKDRNDELEINLLSIPLRQM